MTAHTALPPSSARVLAGPAYALGAEKLAGHEQRLGPRPRGGPWLLDVLARSGLRGRGGAGFPTVRKWRAIAGRSSDAAVVVVNASEGEPLSAKDRTLVSLRPHLVLDGAVLAAETIGAAEIVVYTSRPFGDVTKAVRRAARERRRRRPRETRISIVRTAHRYIAGESSAAVQRINGGPAKPTFAPPHISDHGVAGAPTLVQNAETLAHVALIARFGDDWFRQCGTEAAPGTTLMTVCGGVHHPGVYEVDLAGDLRELLSAAGGPVSFPNGALLGGYFGTWLGPRALADLRLDPDSLVTAGASIGCGVLAVLNQDGCGIVESARILAFLAAETAGQCGPCVFGLPAMADTMQRVAESDAVPGDVERLAHLAARVRGRGACHHPDGAVRLLESALSVFAEHLTDHLARKPCPGMQRRSLPPPPQPGRSWR